MLTPSESPLHQLLFHWWRENRRPQCLAVPKWRASLFEAATDEITAHATRGNGYDPLADRRFLWAAQWLDVADGTRPAVDPDIARIAATHFDTPPTLSRQHLAANG